MTKLDAIRKAIDDTTEIGKHLQIVKLYRIFEQKLNENGYKIVKKK